MRVALLLLGGLMLAQGVAAQDNLVPSKSLIVGVLARGYSVDKGPVTHQIAIPVAAVFPVNERFSFDIGTYYASTTSKTVGTVSGLTDTQIRGSYVFGRDAIVTTLMVNLPTGTKQTLSGSNVSGAAAANFLAFPVNAYRTGASVTGGVAAATELGSWNVGLAGSLRYSGSYEPFSNDSLTYSPGTEGRIKLGVDRLLGASRLSVGFTFSTFGTDEFQKIAGGNSQYLPGNRYISEASLAFLSGQGSITGYMWDYYRSRAGGSGPANKENILAIGVNGSWPLGTRMKLQPLAEIRLWSPNKGSGKMFGTGAALEVPLGGKFTLSPSARIDFGSLDFTDGTGSHNLTGWGLSALLRYDL